MKALWEWFGSRYLYKVISFVACLYLSIAQLGKTGSWTQALLFLVTFYAIWMLGYGSAAAPEAGGLFVPLEPDKKSIDAIFDLQDLWAEEDDLSDNDLMRKGGRTSDRDWMLRYYSAMVEAAPTVDRLEHQG